MINAILLLDIGCWTDVLVFFETIYCQGNTDIYGVTEGKCCSLPGHISEVKMSLVKRFSLFVVILVLMSAAIHLDASVVSAARKVDFNEQNIIWRDYRSGMVRAKSSHKPVLMIIYTDWWPYCHKLGRAFSDDRIRRASRDFVMIKVNMDHDRETSSKYDIDGQYVPRVFFLDHEGEVLRDIYPPGRHPFSSINTTDRILDLMNKSRSMISRQNLP